MEHYTIGVKRNGLSFECKDIKSDYDISEYDCVFNVLQTYSHNGNGSFNVSIVNKDYMEGFSIGTWKIKEASIVYNWGGMYSSFIMVDDEGVETLPISTDCDRKAGAVITHVESIFQKAIQIISDYPSATIFNLVKQLKNKQEDDIWSKIGNLKEQKYITIEEFLNFMRDYLGTYNKAVSMLGHSNVNGSKLLFRRIIKDFDEIVDKIR